MVELVIVVGGIDLEVLDVGSGVEGFEGRVEECGPFLLQMLHKQNLTMASSSHAV